VVRLQHHFQLGSRGRSKQRAHLKDRRKPGRLTLTSFVLGPQYSWHHANRTVPFAELLMGGAHASGALTSGTTGLTGSENALAMTFGGGVDIQLKSRVTLRALQVDYFLTGFANGSKNNQNNVRIGAGIVLTYGKNID